MSNTAATATAATASPKTITVVNTLDGKEADYTPIGLEYLRKHPSATLTAVVNMLNCHMADMFITMLTIMGDKYGHSIDEMIDTVKADPRWEGVQAHPLLKSLTYFDQRDADSTLTGQKTRAEIPTETLQESVTEIKKARLKKTAVTAAIIAATVPTEETPAKPATKKTTKKAAAAEVEPETAATTIATTDTAAEEAPAKSAAKKTTKKATAATATPAVEESAAPAEESPVKPAAVKKTTKKAAATAAATDDATTAITEKVKALTVNEPVVIAAAPTPAKKAVPKKTVTK